MEGDQSVGDTARTRTFPAALEGVNVFTVLNLVGGELPTWMGSAVLSLPASGAGLPDRYIFIFTAMREAARTSTEAWTWPTSPDVVCNGRRRRRRSVSGAVMWQLRGTQRTNVTRPRLIWQEAKEAVRRQQKNPSPERGRCHLHLAPTSHTLAREN